MDFYGALRARITSLAGGRIYWVERPQTAALPAVTLQVISDPRPQHLKGFEAVRRTDVQIDCWADTHLAASTLMEAVLAAVIPEVTANGIRFDRAMVDSAGDNVERSGDKSVFRERVDIGFWWTAI